MLRLVAFALVVCAVGTQSQDAGAAQGPGDHAGMLLDRLDALATYFGRGDVEAKEMADGIFGVRTAQAACESVAKIQALPLAMRSKATHIAAKLGQIAAKSAAHAKVNDVAYYNQFKPIIQKSVRLPFQERPLPPQSLATVAETHPAAPNADLNEDKSDACFSRLMGTAGHGEAKCSVSPQCWKYMTGGHTSKYMLTHQVLYFEMAAQFKCDSVLDKMYAQHTAKEPGQPSSLKGMVVAKCGHVYREMQNEQSRGGGGSDIFLVQLYTCGAFGYTDFFYPSWLKAAMQAQDNSGCFKDSEESMTAEFAAFGVREGALGEQGAQRKLLRDANTADGCSIHKSSVGSCLYAVYLRHYAALAAQGASTSQGATEKSVLRNMAQQPQQPWEDGPAADLGTAP